MKLLIIFTIKSMYLNRKNVWNMFGCFHCTPLKKKQSGEFSGTYKFVT